MPKWFAEFTQAVVEGVKIAPAVVGQESSGGREESIEEVGWCLDLSPVEYAFDHGDQSSTTIAQEARSSLM